MSCGTFLCTCCAPQFLKPGESAEGKLIVTYDRNPKRFDTAKRSKPPKKLIYLLPRSLRGK